MAPDPSASLIGDYAATGSAEAFAELVRRHAGLVFAVALRITGNAADAEEVSQDCFWTMSRSAAKLKPPLVPWLHRVATCRAINLVRRRNTARWRRQQYADLPAPDDEQPWRQLWPVVDEALLELPVEDRGLLIRHFIEGSSQGEIAAAAGVSQPTVSRRIEDALAGLRKILAKRGVAPLALLTASALATLRADEVPATLTAQLGRLALAGAGGGKIAAAATATAAVKSWMIAAAITALVPVVAWAAVAVLGSIRAPGPLKPAPTIVAAPPSLPAPPAALPGLRLWLSADRGVDLDDGAVAAWRDDDHGIVARAPAPGQRPRPAVLAGGGAALRFDGVDDALTFPLALNGWNEFAAVTVVAVREERLLPPNTQKALWATLMWDEVEDNGGMVLCLHQVGALAAIGTGPSGTPGRPPVGDAEVFAAYPASVGTRLHAVAVLRRPGAMEFWCDGVRLAAVPHDQRPLAAVEDLGQIGRGTGETWIAKPYSGGRTWHKYVGFSYAPVDVAEIMVADRAPSAVELQRVFAAIAARQHLAPAVRDAGP